MQWTAPVSRAVRLRPQPRVAQPYLSRTLDGCVYVVDAADMGVGRDVYAFGRRPEFVVLERAVSVIGAPAEHAQFVDVGANIGTTTVPALVRHGFRSGVVCEPGRQAVRALRMALAANDLESRVEVVEAAVSDREGTVWMRMDPGQAGTSEVVPFEERDSVEVPSVTLDALADRGSIDPGRVGLVWVDAQGHEAQVLAGAERVLGEGAPLVVALRPKKLRRGGGATFPDLLERSFAYVADLRAPGLRAANWQAVVEPVAAVRRYIDENRKTDILLLP